MLKIDKIDESNIRIRQDSIIDIVVAAIFFASTGEKGNNVITVSPKSASSHKSYSDILENIEINGVSGNTYTPEEACIELNSFIGNFKSGGSSSANNGGGGTVINQANWGQVKGDINDQSDLITELDKKQPVIIRAVCDSPANDNNKVVTIPDYIRRVGDILAITYTYGNTSNLVGIDVNGTGSMSVQMGGGNPSGTIESDPHFISPRMTVLYYYTGDMGYILFGRQNAVSLDTDTIDITNLIGALENQFIVNPNTISGFPYIYSAFIGICDDKTVEKISDCSPNPTPSYRYFTLRNISLFENIFFTSINGSWVKSTVLKERLFSRYPIGDANWKYPIGYLYDKTGLYKANNAITNFDQTSLYVGGLKSGNYFVPSEYSLTLRDPGLAYKRIGYFTTQGFLYLTDYQPVYVNDGTNWIIAVPQMPVTWGEIVGDIVDQLDISPYIEKVVSAMDFGTGGETVQYFQMPNYFSPVVTRFDHIGVQGTDIIVKVTMPEDGYVKIYADPQDNGWLIGINYFEGEDNSQLFRGGLNPYEPQQFGLFPVKKGSILNIEAVEPNKNNADITFTFYPILFIPSGYPPDLISSDDFNQIVSNIATTIVNGSKGMATWGKITGILSDQTDLRDVLNKKQEVVRAYGLMPALNSVVSATKGDLTVKFTKTVGPTGAAKLEIIFPTARNYYYSRLTNFDLTGTESGNNRVTNSTSTTLSTNEGYGAQGKSNTIVVVDFTNGIHYNIKTVCSNNGTTGDAAWASITIG
jgi:hypothetical protein